MDALRFDTATQRLPGLLTRRRGVGLLAALGVGLALEGNDASPRKRKKGGKKRKKKFCRCAECSTCVKGKCRPAPDRTECRAGACFSGVCEPTT